MSILTFNNIPSKFSPFLIGSSSCQADIKNDIDAVFEKSPLKCMKSNYIIDAGKWVLKLPRTDMPTAADSHIYRVRKAEKIRNYIQKNHLENDLVVPKKYLYWKESEQKFYTVAEKLDLSEEVVETASIEVENSFKQFSHIGGQIEVLASQNCKKRSLNPVQAKALAELSILGYTDLTYNNLYFTKDGKVAIIDTEPVKRLFKKAIKSSPIFYIFGNMSITKCQQALVGIAKLKVSINNPEALKAVEKVERNHALWNIALSITKIAFTSLCIYFAPTVTANIQIAAIEKIVRVSFKIFAIFKNVYFVLGLIGTCVIWKKSCSGLNGLNDIALMEMNGLI